MGKKLYVGNLAYGITDSDLEQLFAPHGTVQSAQVIMDRDTGRSKGFGFVEMGSDQEAQTAIQNMNGKEVDGRSLTVNEARPKEGGGGGGGRGGGGRGGGPIFGGGGPMNLNSGSDRRYNLTLSASARNIFNKVNLGNPGGVLGSPFFDKFNSLQGGPFSTGVAVRRIDLQATFSF
jgi:RNA recognition motif-containing protein